jgi:hypothetical protein
MRPVSIFCFVTRALKISGEIGSVEEALAIGRVLTRNVSLVSLNLFPSTLACCFRSRLFAYASLYVYSS